MLVKSLFKSCIFSSKQRSTIFYHFPVAGGGLINFLSRQLVIEVHLFLLPLSQILLQEASWDEMAAGFPQTFDNWIQGLFKDFEGQKQQFSRIYFKAWSPLPPLLAVRSSQTPTV